MRCSWYVGLSAAQPNSICRASCCSTRPVTANPSCFSGALVHQPLLRSFVIFEPDAGQGIAVLFRKALGAGLSRPEDQACSHPALSAAGCGNRGRVASIRSFRKTEMSLWKINDKQNLSPRTKPRRHEEDPQNCFIGPLSSRVMPSFIMFSPKFRR